MEMSQKPSAEEFNCIVLSPSPCVSPRLGRLPCLVLFCPARERSEQACSPMGPACLVMDCSISEMILVLSEGIHSMDQRTDCFSFLERDLLKREKHTSETARIRKVTHLSCAQCMSV